MQELEAYEHFVLSGMCLLCVGLGGLNRVYGEEAVRNNSIDC